MFALYRKELKRYFGSVPTIVCVTLLVFCQGLLTALFNFSALSASLASPLAYMIYPAAILLPIPVLLATRRIHTVGAGSYLLSLPVSATAIVAAQYLAALTMLLVTFAPMALCPLLFALLGTVNFASCYVALLGYALLSGSILAIALVVGTLVKRPILRVGITYGILAVFLLISLIPNYLPLSDTAYRVVCGISPFTAFEGFLYGHFYLVGTVVLLLLTGVCLGICVWRLQCVGRGASTFKRRAVAAALALGACLPLCLGAIAPLLPRNAVYFDVTGSETFRLSGASRDYLRTLDEDVTVYYLCNGGRLNAYSSMEQFLENYQAVSAHIAVEYVDTAQESAFAARYTSDTLSDHSFIVESGTRYYVIDSVSLYHYYNAAIGQNFTPQYYVYCLDAADYYVSTGSLGSYDEASVEYGSALYLYADQTVAYFDGDALLTNAILYVTSDKVPTVGVFCGEGYSLESNLRSILIANGYFFRDLPTLDDLTDCDMLLIYSPSRDLSEAETDVLHTYMEAGGDLFLATSCAYNDLPNLLTVLNTYGLDARSKKNMVCQKSASTDSYATSFYASVDMSAAASGDFNGSLVMLLPHAITVREVDGVNVIEWITTGKNGSYLYSDEVDSDGTITDELKETLDERAGEYVCGAIAEKGDSRVIWISSALSIGLTGYSYSDGGNYALVRSALDWATDNAFDALSVEPTSIESQTLSMSSGQIAVCVLAVAVLVPLAVAAICGVRVYIRKKR